jgi:murein DD-endopeptidase MepM/ murein hydrolase activator NlpD
VPRAGVRIRLLVALVIATVSWFPQGVQTAHALYCWPGDPPAVYQACVDYNAGIGQQVVNQRELQRIQNQIAGAEAQMNAIGALINNLKRQIALQQALIAQTQATIDDLSRQIRFGEADLTRLRAHLSVRDGLLNQRLRYIDGHGTLNYVQLVLTANSFNEMMNRMVAAQQVAASDRKLLADLEQQHSMVALANADLDVKRGQVTALLQQEKAAEAELQKSLKAQADAMAYAQKLETQLSAQYAAVQAQRAAIDAQVAQLQQQYQAAARAAGGGTGQFDWPEPQCGHGCVSQGFGCNSYWFEQYEPNCPYPHRIHTGIDIAGPYGTPVIAADTGVVYFYPGSYGYGNYIVMIHGNGYSTLYGHLARFNTGMSSGAIIARGDLIGYEGSTGNSTGPHLHFEIRTNNVWRNPCLWLGC